MIMSGAEQPRTTSELPPESDVLVGKFRYVRAPVPVHFPVGAEVPESKRHLVLRTLVYQFLDRAFAQVAGVGCDQFVYWDPTDPRACLAPDAFVRFGEPDDLFTTWKTWERGAPHVAVEIISDTDRGEAIWQEKLHKYRRLGVAELVRFEPESSELPLRVWDLVGTDLVERKLTEQCVESSILPGFWLMVEQPGLGLTLRLSHDEQGEQLYLTQAEALQAELAARPR